MGNMPYCKFRNTVRDLVDCQDSLLGLAAADDEPLSSEELRAAQELIVRCKSLLLLLLEVMPAGFIYADSEERVDAAIEALEKLPDALLEDAVTAANQYAADFADARKEDI